MKSCILYCTTIFALSILCLVSGALDETFNIYEGSQWPSGEYTLLDKAPEPSLMTRNERGLINKIKYWLHGKGKWNSSKLEVTTKKDHKASTNLKSVSSDKKDKFVSSTSDKQYEIDSLFVPTYPSYVSGSQRDGVAEMIRASQVESPVTSHRSSPDGAYLKYFPQLSRAYSSMHSGQQVPTSNLLKTKYVQDDRRLLSRWSQVPQVSPLFAIRNMKTTLAEGNYREPYQLPSLVNGSRPNADGQPTSNPGQQSFSEIPPFLLSWGVNELSSQTSLQNFTIELSSTGVTHFPSRTTSAVLAFVYHSSTSELSVSSMDPNFGSERTPETDIAPTDSFLFESQSRGGNPTESSLHQNAFELELTGGLNKSMTKPNQASFINHSIIDYLNMSLSNSKNGKGYNKTDRPLNVPMKKWQTQTGQPTQVQTEQDLIPRNGFVQQILMTVVPVDRATSLSFASSGQANNFTAYRIRSNEAHNVEKEVLSNTEESSLDTDLSSYRQLSTLNNDMNYGFGKESNEMSARVNSPVFGRHVRGPKENRLNTTERYLGINPSPNTNNMHQGQGLKKRDSNLSQLISQLDSSLDDLKWKVVNRLKQIELGNIKSGHGNPRETERLYLLMTDIKKRKKMLRRIASNMTEVDNSENSDSYQLFKDLEHAMAT